MKKVGLFFGGLGNEAEVSIISAQNIYANFDTAKYQPCLIFWNKDGNFYKLDKFLDKITPKKKIAERDFGDIIDIALPITHGRYGEDGILQGIFERYGISYAGCRVLSSALCMDKAVFKKYMEGQGMRQVKFQAIDLNVLSRKEIDQAVEKIKREFSLPIFIKPANSGSSVGVVRVKKYEDIRKAIREASAHDRKIIIEEGLVKPREIEVGVLGNNELIISDPGELILAKEFYDYDDKYKKNETEIMLKTDLEAKIKRQIIAMAEKAYRLCDCRGFARIDFFISENKVYLNEINTLPGFTQASMYPLLMMNTGMSYPELINKIIELAY